MEELQVCLWTSPKHAQTPTKYRLCLVWIKKWNCKQGISSGQHYHPWLEWLKMCQPHQTLFRQTTAGHLNTGWLTATVTGRTCQVKANNYWSLNADSDPSLQNLSISEWNVHPSFGIWEFQLGNSITNNKKPGGTKRTDTERDIIWSYNCPLYPHWLQKEPFSKPFHFSKRDRG